MVVSKKILENLDRRLSNIENLISVLAGATGDLTPQPTKPVASMTTSTTPKVENTTYECSICGAPYTTKENNMCGWMRPRVVIERFKNFGSPANPLYRYHNFSCCERLSRAISALQSDIVTDTYATGAITH
jgi:hypothetical protein